uniref:Uncharacterized protein n=1 Tax=Arundo donax TaxID=35708 RepID=A0A0A8XMW7_ARUDO
MEKGHVRTTLATTASSSASVPEKRAMPDDGAMDAAAVGITTKRPNTKDDTVPEAAGSKEDDKSPAKRPKTEGEMEAGSKEEESKSMAAAKPKRMRLARFSKEGIELRLSRPRPTPYRRTSDEFLDTLPPDRRDALRAFDDDCAEFFQKLIDRDAEIFRQYSEKGWAEIEFTDDEDEVDTNYKPLNYIDYDTWLSKQNLYVGGNKGVS